MINFVFGKVHAKNLPSQKLVLRIVDIIINLVVLWVFDDLTSEILPGNLVISHFRVPLCFSFKASLVVRNNYYENDFDLHEKKTVCRTHFHMKGFALRLFFSGETEAQENSEMAYSIIIGRRNEVLLGSVVR